TCASVGCSVRCCHGETETTGGDFSVAAEYSRGGRVVAAESSESLPVDLLRGLASGAFWACGARFSDRVRTVARRTGQECLESVVKMARRGHGEGSIYQRKDGRWAAALTLENHKRKTFYGETRKEVQHKLNAALHEQKQGVLATGPQQ